MAAIGFSTGALVRGDVKRALELLADFSTDAVELSALREEELPRLVAQLPSLDLSSFDYVSLHVPSRRTSFSEQELVEMLASIALYLPMVVHPQVIETPALWEQFGDRLCIENMDGRKSGGQTVADLDPLFRALPEASFCFDAGHALQVDPSLGIAHELLEAFRARLRQVHLSDVGADGEHKPLALASAQFRPLAREMARVPVIIEANVAPGDLQRELDAVRQLLAR